jgi:hypothetical protein
MKTASELEWSHPDLDLLRRAAMKIRGNPFYITAEDNFEDEYRVSLRAPPGGDREVIHRRLTYRRVLDFLRENRNVGEE